MQESNSRPESIDANSDSEESSEISDVPQLQKLSSSIAEETQKVSGEFVKIENRSQKIDEEGILEFLKKQQSQIKNFKQASNKIKKKSQIKVQTNPSKKHDLNQIKRKWKAEMDKYITKYKEYLKQQKTTLDGKEKEYLLEFYKVLLDGIYELKELNEDPHNDLTSNEKKIIAVEADFYLYLKDLVEKYNQVFRDAKFSGKILHIKVKWDPLIKNCKDQNNLELRRKIIRAKIKPEQVLTQSDDFLLSENAKLQEERRRKLILNEAEKNFEKPLDYSEGQMEIESGKESEYLPDAIDSFKSIPSQDNTERRLMQQKEKIEEYKHLVGDEPLIRVKKRIIELLGNTVSFDRIIEDFNSKFQHV